MKQQPKWYVHVLGWAGLYVCWVMVFQKQEFVLSQTATIEFCYLLFIAANYYLHVGFAIPRFLYRRKYIAYVGTALAGIVVAALLRVPLAAFLFTHYFKPGQPAPGFQKLFAASLLNISIWTLVLVSIRIIVDRYRFQQQMDQARREKEQAELDFLNAQLNPHFLFNSINSIYGHINKENAGARSMLLTFSEMLRYQLYECNQKVVPVEKELSYIKNYIELQKVRKEDDLALQYSVDLAVRNFQVAPLLFIAFIENAFKYLARNSKGEYAIAIHFEMKGEQLHLHCSNSYARGKTMTIEHRGIGMDNARRRLALLYPGKHTLEIDDATDVFTVNLLIDII